MNIAEELQQRADELKVRNWVNHVPETNSEECLLIRLIVDDSDRTAYVGTMSTAAQYFFLWTVGLSIWDALGPWNDDHTSVGPIIADLEEAAIFAKEMGI